MTNVTKNQEGIKLNLGCGKFPIHEFINCDIQKYPGVDKVMDCQNLTCFSDNCAELIFNSSFFEHLYIAQHASFLEHCFRVLRKGGALIMLGIPDFEETARCYLAKKAGLRPFGGTFDLYQAYRLTHGDFESEEGSSVPQMHKTLFDKDTLNAIFATSNFPHYRVFRYKFQDEQYPLSLGVVASKGVKISDEQLEWRLKPFDSIITDLQYNQLNKNE